MTVAKSTTLALAAIFTAFAVGSCGAEGGTRHSELPEAASANEKVSLGRWCLRPTSLPGTWKVLELFDGDSPMATYSFADGSRVQIALVRQEDGEFREVGDPHSANWQITAENGVVIYDHSGLIAEADPMEPDASIESCF